MIATVTKAYTDRITGVVHFAGDEVDLTAERLQELSTKGYAAAAPADVAPTDEAAAGEAADEAPEEGGAAQAAGAPEPATAEEIDLMTVPELSEYIVAHGGAVPSKVRKAELAEIAKGL